MVTRAEQSRHAPRVQHAQTLVGHAVHAPVDVAVIIAYGYREATVVGPDQADHLVHAAIDLQRFALARVRRLVHLLRAAARAAAAATAAAVRIGGGRWYGDRSAAAGRNDDENGQQNGEQRIGEARRDY